MHGGVSLALPAAQPVVWEKTDDANREIYLQLLKPLVCMPTLLHWACSTLYNCELILST